MRIKQSSAKIFILLSALFLNACNSGSSFDDASHIGNYKSPFADNKVKLDIPQYKTVIGASNQIALGYFPVAGETFPTDLLIAYWILPLARYGAGRRRQGGFRPSGIG